MTYDTNERSVQDAAPIELYTFQVYQTVYRFCTASTNQTVQLRTYTAAAIKRSAPESTGEIARNNITIRTRADFPVTDLFNGVPPSDVVLLVIQRLHRTDTVPQPFWNGRVLSCKYEGDEAVFHCENIYTSLRRTGLRRKFGRGCPWVLYGPDCRAVEAEHAVSVTLTDVDGRSLSGAGFNVGSDGRFAGGYVKWESAPGIVHQRGIVGHDGDTVTITYPIPELSSGTTISASPGCKHNLADCDAFFDNVENYGGLAPYLAGKNPFGNNSVF